MVMELHKAGIGSNGRCCNHTGATAILVNLTVQITITDKIVTVVSNGSGCGMN